MFFSNLLDMVGRPFSHEAENRKFVFEAQTDTRLAPVWSLYSNACSRSKNRFPTRSSLRNKEEFMLECATHWLERRSSRLCGAASVVAFLEVSDVV